MAFILFIGGVRSGKSRLAQAWAEAAAPDRVLLATCHAKDAEMATRIAEHKKARGSGWQCLEEPLEPMAALNSWHAEYPDASCSFVLDSLGMWIANLMCQNLPAAAISKRIRALADALAQPQYACAVVSDECGLGFVPLNGVARKYGDILGSANQTMAKKANAVIFVSCGLPLALKGSVPAVLDRYVSSN